MTTLLYLTLAALAIAAMWWLSGYDSRVTGENPVADFIRRALRILITVFLVALVFGLHPARMGAGYGFIPVLMTMPILIGLIWCGCLSEWWSHGLQSIVFSEDKGRYDPHKDQRELGNLSVLLRNGRHEEALLLARQLHEAGDVNILALEAMLTRAGVPWETPKADDPIVKAARLRAQGDFVGAENILVPFLEQHPHHVQALLLLLRLYA